jgi:hypothetical protein
MRVKWPFDRTATFFIGGKTGNDRAVLSALHAATGFFRTALLAHGKF